VNDALGDVVREGGELRQHEGHEQQQRQEDRDHLGDERQGHFLNLRQSLEQRDRQADDQRDQHDRRADLEGDHHHLARHVEGLDGVHE
jgi:hypothetical protein